MVKKRSIFSLISLIVVIFIVFGGFTFYYNYQTKVVKAKEAEEERIKQEEEQKRLEQEKIAKQKAEYEALRNQLVSGQYDPNLKAVFLTFDDGPDSCSTEVLDLLKNNNIKATFFTNGKTGPENEEIYRRIVNEGHVLANHTYSHNYDIYNNTQSFLDDVLKQEQNLRAITGIEPVKLFRFPGGSNMTSTDNINALLGLGYNYFDWTSSAGDGASVLLPPEQVVAKIMSEVHQNQVSVILCHAENPAKTTTREALQPLINQLKAEGYIFLTLDPAYTIDKAKFDV